MKTKPVLDAFIGGAGIWGVRQPVVGRTHAGLPPAVTGRSGRGKVAVQMMHGQVAELGPSLFAQLAGCAVLVGTGQYLHSQPGGDEHEDLEKWIVDHNLGLEGKEKEVDLYRDTWVRYFGYFNEVGEAFRPIVPVLVVTLSYVVAFAYIGADSYSQGAKVTRSGQWGLPSVLATVDSLLFQGMASVVFPSFTINRWVTMMGALLAQLDLDLPDVVTEYLPTLTGLVIIPLICPPLDTLTHRILDMSYRPASEAVLSKSTVLKE